jgi:hypothetical protein
MFPSRAGADELLKIGICIPMTGAGFNAVGRQLSSAIKLYVEQHGDAVAGRKLEIVMRDDGGVADNARRIVQEMIVRDKASLIAIGITPTSLAVALGDGSQNRHLGPELRRLDHRNQVPLHGTGRICARSAIMDHGGMGSPKRQQTFGYLSERLGAGH